MTVIRELAPFCPCPPCQDHAIVIWFENPAFPTLGEPAVLVRRVVVPVVLTGGTDQAIVSAVHLQAAGVECVAVGGDLTIHSVRQSWSGLAGRIRAVGIDTGGLPEAAPFPYSWEIGNGERETWLGDQTTVIRGDAMAFEAEELARESRRGGTPHQERATASGEAVAAHAQQHASPLTSAPEVREPDTKRTRGTPLWGEAT